MKRRVNFDGIVFYIILLMLLISVVMLKKNYHVDEIFTYGLANHIGSIAMNPEKAPYTYSPASDAYLEYMTVQEGGEFNFKNVWKNQARDVHPPLYYVLIHIMSSIYKGKFTKWIAGSINIVFMLLTFAVFRKIVDLFQVPDKEKLLVSLFFVFNTGILSSVSFFRMYIMAMFEITYLTYIILKYREKETFKFYVLVFLTCVAGVLTHYYFLIYLFFISIFYEISMLYEKRFRSAIGYIICMVIAGGVSYAAFPGMIAQIFGSVGGQGIRSFENLHKGLDVYYNNLKTYFGILNNELFGGMLLFLIFLFLFSTVFGNNKHAKVSLKMNDKKWSYLVAFMPSICYFLLVSKISIQNTDRYMMPIFPMLLLCGYCTFTIIINKYFEWKMQTKQIVIAAICAIVIANGWNICSWDYLYTSSNKVVNKMKSYSNVDGLYVCSTSFKMHNNYEEVSKLKSITFFDKDISQLKDMENLNSQNEYVLYVVDKRPEKIIQDIMEICPQITDYKEIGSYGFATSYYLFGGE